MRIYNLTEGEWKCGISIDELSKNCHNMIMQAMAASHYPLRNFMYKKYLHTRWRQEMDELLNAVPVFLVNKNQLGPLEIPDQNLAVVVPKFDGSNDGYGKVFRDPNGKPIKESSKDDALSKWIDNIGKWLKGEFNCCLTTNCIINRQLGEHHYNGSHTLMPSRIFVWVDAVSEEAEAVQIDKVLFLQFVILHEYAHALMSVRLYGVKPTEIFYQPEQGDSFIEEAFANAFALQVLKSNSIDVSDLLMNFTGKQPIGYNWASAIIDNKDIDVFKVINEWMRMKVMIDDMIFVRLNAFNNQRLNGTIDFNQLLPQEGEKQIDMFYPMGIHFRERYYGNVSFETYPMIYTSEDGGIWYSSEFKKQRSDRVFHYDNGKTKLVDDDHTKSITELIKQ